MTYRKYFSIIAGIAIVGWTSFTLVITRLSPCTGPGMTTLCYATSPLALILFFLSAFFALTSTFTLLGFALRFWLHRYEMYLDHLTTSLRHGILLGFVTLGELGLLLFGALPWWSGLLLVMIIILLEFYFTREG